MSFTRRARDARLIVEMAIEWIRVGERYEAELYSATVAVVSRREGGGAAPWEWRLEAAEIRAMGHAATLREAQAAVIDALGVGLAA